MAEQLTARELRRASKLAGRLHDVMERTIMDRRLPLTMGWDLDYLEVTLAKFALALDRHEQEGTP